jgi:hypothetical protein
MSPRMPRDVADGEWVNPYRVTKRSADTLNLVAEGRLYIHIHQTWNEEAGRFGPTERRWVLIGGSVGWRNEALAWANRFLDAGVIDYHRPAGIGLDEPHPQLRNKTRVFLTQAGRYLYQTWHHRPFEVIEKADPAAPWQCRNCGSQRWVGWRNGPAEEGWPRRAQCVPCGHVQALPEGELTTG